MKSNVYSFSKDSLDIAIPLSQADKVAAYCSYDFKSKSYLRLLTEELIGMTEQMLGSFDAKFFIEATEDNFELHLTARNSLNNGELREELLEMSTSGKNEATRGFMGKLRRVVEMCLYGDYNSVQSIAITESDPNLITVYWTLKNYEAQLHQETGKDDWDELEKSVVAKLADDIKVGILNNKVEIILTKSIK